jgi:hypothetical protein
MKTTHIVQINMADAGTKPEWVDCEDAEFVQLKEALVHIEWMKKEYGDTIEFRTRTAFYSMA